MMLSPGTGVQHFASLVSVPGAPVLRQSAGDPLTVNAPPPVAPALPTGADGDGGNWSSGASPAESIRTLFG